MLHGLGYSGVIRALNLFCATTVTSLVTACGATGDADTRSVTEAASAMGGSQTSGGAATDGGVLGDSASSLGGALSDGAFPGGANAGGSDSSPNAGSSDGGAHEAGGDTGMAGAGGASASAANRFENPGFEDGTATGWTSFGGGELTVVDSVAYSGTYSVESGSRKGAWIGPNQSILGKVESGETIGVSGWVLHNERETVSFKITLRTAVEGSDPVFVPMGSLSVPPGEWTQITGTARVEGIDAAASVDVYFEGPPADVVFYLDDAEFRVMPPVGAGGTTGAGGAPGVGGQAGAGVGGAVGGESGAEASGGTSGIGGSPGVGGAGGVAGAQAMAGTAGASGDPGVGGAGGAGGTGGASAGSGNGSGGAAGGQSGTTGFARLSVPLSAVNQKAWYFLQTGLELDMSAAVLNLRVKAPGALGGALQPFVQQDGGSYSMCWAPKTDLADLAAQEGLIDVTFDVGGSDCSTKTGIGRIGIQIAADNASTEWANPSLVYVDAIEITGAVPADPQQYSQPWTFDTSDSVSTSQWPGANVLWLANNQYDPEPPAGTTISWVEQL
ncbi:carbohydrate binding domain-containing protein [Myxococcota bacterium]